MLHSTLERLKSIAWMWRLKQTRRLSTTNVLLQVCGLLCELGAGGVFVYAMTLATWMHVQYDPAKLMPPPPEPDYNHTTTMPTNPAAVSSSAKLVTPDFGVQQLAADAWLLTYTSSRYCGRTCQLQPHTRLLIMTEHATPWLWCRDHDPGDVAPQCGFLRQCVRLANAFDGSAAMHEYCCDGHCLYSSQVQQVLAEHGQSLMEPYLTVQGNSVVALLLQVCIYVFLLCTLKYNHAMYARMAAVFAALTAMYQTTVVLTQHYMIAILAGPVRSRPYLFHLNRHSSLAVHATVGNGAYAVWACVAAHLASAVLWMHYSRRLVHEYTENEPNNASNTSD